MTEIYTLADPIQLSHIRYLGKTSMGHAKRLVGHICDAKSGRISHKRNWIKSLLLRGRVPVCTVIDHVDDEHSACREIYWINRLRNEGHDLTNTTLGGEGTLGIRRPHSEEVKAKIGAANRGKARSPELLSRLSAIHRGKTISESHRKRISESLRGRKKTSEHIAKVVAKLKGRKRNPISAEQREKLRESSVLWWANHREEILLNRRAKRLERVSV